MSTIQCNIIEIPASVIDFEYPVYSIIFHWRKEAGQTDKGRKQVTIALYSKIPWVKRSEPFLNKSRRSRRTRTACFTRYTRHGSLGKRYKESR